MRGTTSAAIGSAMAGLAGLRYAIFALPMIGILLLGAIYLAYSIVVCDPLYANDSAAAGYKSGPAAALLSPLLPPGYSGDKALPVPTWDFGACSTPR